MALTKGTRTSRGSVLVQRSLRFIGADERSTATPKSRRTTKISDGRTGPMTRRQGQRHQLYDQWEQNTAMARRGATGLCAGSSYRVIPVHREIAAPATRVRGAHPSPRGPGGHGARAQRSRRRAVPAARPSRGGRGRAPEHRPSRRSLLGKVRRRDPRSSRRDHFRRGGPVSRRAPSAAASRHRLAPNTFDLLYEVHLFASFRPSLLSGWRFTQLLDGRAARRSGSFSPQLSSLTTR